MVHLCVDVKRGLGKSAIQIFFKALTASEDFSLKAPFIPIILLNIEFEVFWPAIVVDKLNGNRNVIRTEHG